MKPDGVNDVDEGGTKRVTDEARRPLYNFWALIMGIAMLFFVGFMILLVINR